MIDDDFGSTELHAIYMYDMYDNMNVIIRLSSASMYDICVRGRESYTPHIQFMNFNMIVS